MKKIKLFEEFATAAVNGEVTGEINVHEPKEKKPEKKFTVTKAPDAAPMDDRPRLFLAGSIEMGKAEDWQSKVQDLLKDENVSVFNPRRDDWDSSWEQTIQNPKFREQVEWELSMLANATTIIMYFDEKTESPITLLELGLHAGSGKLMVCCPDKYYRKGNVDIVCAKYNIPMFDTLEDLVAATMVKIKGMY